jgi:Ulp1 family protease
VPSIYYQYLQNHTNYREVLIYLFNQRALLADIVLVLTCTGNGSGNDSAEHWILGVISKPKETVYLLDSLEHAKMRPTIFKNLGILVDLMYRAENLSTNVNEWKYIYSNNCSLQENSFDCGIFSILNAYTILQMTKMPEVSSEMGRRWVLTHLKKYVANDSVEAPIKPRDSIITDKTIGFAVRIALQIAKGDEEEPFEPLIICENTNKTMRKLLHDQM